MEAAEEEKDEKTPEAKEAEEEASSDEEAAEEEKDETAPGAKEAEEEASSDEEAAEEEKDEKSPEAKEAEEEEAGSDEEAAEEEKDEKTPEAKEAEEEAGSDEEEKEEGESSVRTSDFSVSSDSPWTTRSSGDDSESEDIEALMAAALQAARIAELDCVPGYWEWASHPNPKTTAQEVFCVTLRDEEMVAEKNKRRSNPSLLQKKPAAKIGGSRSKANAKRKGDELEANLDEEIERAATPPLRRLRTKTHPTPSTSSQFFKTTVIALGH